MACDDAPVVADLFGQCRHSQLTAFHHAETDVRSVPDYRNRLEQGFQ